MKKALALFLVMVVCLPIAACSSNKKAFETSKAAYNSIDIAYQITEEYGSDIYEAWRLAIYDDDEILDNGVKFLASELNLSEDELRNGMVYVIADIYGEQVDTLSEERKNVIAENDVAMFAIMEDSLFSFCVMVVNGAYEANGKAAEAQSALDAAKAQMKELSENYSDYEHYPNLKGYYTTTSSFFQFCQEPTGSFEQIKTTINDYRKESRDYISDLDYIFEE